MQMELREFIKAEKILKVGQRVEIIVDGQPYSSRIEDFNDVDLILAMPLDSKRRPLLPESGTKIDACIFSDQCVYQFFSKYKDKLAAPIPVWIVSLPVEVEKKQNRKFVRVPAAIPIQVQIPDEDGGLSSPQLTETKDISGSGFLFIFKQPVALKTKIVLETEVLAQVGRIKTFAEVVRCSKPVPGRDLYWIGVKFIGLARPLQNKLVQFVFQKQREELAKRLK